MCLCRIVTSFLKGVSPCSVFWQELCILSLCKQSCAALVPAEVLSLFYSYSWVRGAQTKTTHFCSSIFISCMHAYFQHIHYFMFVVIVVFVPNCPFLDDVCVCVCGGGEGY